MIRNGLEFTHESIKEQLRLLPSSVEIINSYAAFYEKGDFSREYEPFLETLNDIVAIH